MFFSRGLWFGIERKGGYEGVFLCVSRASGSRMILSGAVLCVRVARNVAKHEWLLVLTPGRLGNTANNAFASK